MTPKTVSVLIFFRSDIESKEGKIFFDTYYYNDQISPFHHPSFRFGAFVSVCVRVFFRQIQGRVCVGSPVIWWWKVAVVVAEWWCAGDWRATVGDGCSLRLCACVRVFGRLFGGGHSWWYEEEKAEMKGFGGWLSGGYGGVLKRSDGSRVLLGLSRLSSRLKKKGAHLGFFGCF